MLETSIGRQLSEVYNIVLVELLRILLFKWSFFLSDVHVVLFLFFSLNDNIIKVNTLNFPIVLRERMKLSRNLQLKNLQLKIRQVTT